MSDNSRTVDDVIAEWRERKPSKDEPRDDELILAEITRLRAEVAQQGATRRAALDEAVNVVKSHRAGWATRPIGKGAEKVLDEVMTIERALTALRDAEEPTDA